MKQPKTQSSKTTVKLVPQIAGLLAGHRKRSSFQAATDFIFHRGDGSPLIEVTLRKHLYAAMKEAGIKRLIGQYGRHIFRHSAGTILHAKTRDLKLVQSALRHADISTTADIYVHLDDQVLSEGSEILIAEILGSCDLTVTQKSEMVN